MNTQHKCRDKIVFCFILFYRDAKFPMRPMIDETVAESRDIAMIEIGDAPL